MWLQMLFLFFFSSLGSWPPYIVSVAEHELIPSHDTENTGTMELHACSVLRVNFKQTFQFSGE